MWYVIGVFAAIGTGVGAGALVAYAGYRSAEGAICLRDWLELIVSVVFLMAVCAVLLAILSRATYRWQPGECGAASLAILVPSILLLVLGPPCAFMIFHAARQIGARRARQDDEES